MSLLDCTGVTGARGGRVLFADLDLTLGPGDAAVVTGANGSGKSTLLRIAAGLLPAQAGRVGRCGRIGWLGEGTALDGERLLADALYFWTRADGVSDPRGRAGAALAAMGLAALAGVPVRLFSTGQRRRAAIARVIASGARLWLLDEPANGLDDASVAALAAAIAKHRAEGGAVLLATHQPLALADARQVALG